MEWLAALPAVLSALGQKNQDSSQMNPTAGLSKLIGGVQSLTATPNNSNVYGPLLGATAANNANPNTEQAAANGSSIASSLANLLRYGKSAYNNYETNKTNAANAQAQATAQGIGQRGF